MQFTKERRAAACFLGGILLLTAVAYLPIWGSGFVYDDLWFVVQNPAIRSLSMKAFFLNAVSVASPGAGMALDIYRPLATLSFALGYLVWHLNPLAEHGVNLALHLLNGVLFFLVSERLLASRYARLLAAAVFLFHPAQVETVAWISQRSTLLCASGFLLALWGLLGRAENRPAGILGWVLSVFSKETGVMLAPLGAILSSRRWRLVAVWAALTVPFWLLRHHVLGGWSSSAVDAGTPLWQRMSLGALAFPIYLKQTLLPWGLRVSYDTPDWTLGGVCLGGGLVLSYIGGTAAAIWRKSPWAVPLAWFLLLLLPVLHLVPIVPFVNERFMYLPLMGAAIAVGMGWDRWQRGRGAMLIWIVWLWILCVRQTPVWISEQSLWANAVRWDPANAFAHACYAQTLGDSDQAETEYFKALLCAPSHSLRRAVSQNLAVLHHLRGRTWKAQYWKMKTHEKS